MHTFWQSMFLNGNKLRFSLVLNLSWLLSFNSASAAAAMPSATLTPHTVYINNFSVGAGPEWSDAMTTEVNGEKFLGANDGHGFGPGSTTLTLNLPDHTEITVSFDLYIIESWGGNSDGTNNNWQLTADGNNLLATSFSNCVGLTQDYPNQMLNYGAGGTFEARTGAFENGHLGFGTDCMGDATYRLSYTFPHTAPTLALTFIGMEYQKSENKGWGLDNVRVDIKPADDKIVYSTDFTEAYIGDEWTSSVGTLTQVEANGELFLGTDDYASGAGTTTLMLTDLPPHSEAAVNADLYIINSWDGNGLVGNGLDNFQLSADATNLLFTNFAMNPEQTQTYPNQLPPYGAVGAFAPNFNAFEVGHLGDVLGYNATYRLAYRFAHTEPFLELAFTSMQDEAAADESWGLDNIQVNVLSSTTLSVVKTGNGSGYVTSDLPGIDCGIGIGADCAEDYPLNTTVILTAIAITPGNRFTSWEGCPEPNSNTCKVTMMGHKTITARFDKVPDFVVTAITVVPSPVRINVPFTIQVTVKNQGSLAANAGRLALWLNSPTVPACRATGADRSVTVGTLAIGQSKTFTFTGLTYTTPGNKIIRLFVDADCITQESDENNNQLTKMISLGGPDLVITTLAPIPSTPMANSQFAARVMVKNQGAEAGIGGTLSVWVDQLATPSTVCKSSGNATATIGTLAAGASQNFIVPGLNAGPTAGTKTLRAYIDSNCILTEFNLNVTNAEANNQLTKTYRVTAGVADLVITKIVLTPATPTANKELVAKVSVKNQGTLASSDNFLDVWLDQPTAQTCGTSGDAWASVGVLNPGASTTVTVNGLTAGTIGVKIMRTFVDSWCEIIESNETNNQFSIAYKVQ